MIHIFYGSNSSASRKAFADALLTAQKNIPEVIESDSVEQLSITIRTSQSLFASKTLYVLENVLSLKKHRDELLTFCNHEACDIYVWDSKTDERTITSHMKNTRLQKFAYSENVWKLLDGLVPGNKKTMCALLKNVLAQEESPLLLFLIQRRTKELLLAKKKLYGGTKKQAWQLANIDRQASRWESAKLLTFYKKLIDIEVATKTSTLMYPLEDALEMLLGFHL